MTEELKKLSAGLYLYATSLLNNPPPDTTEKFKQGGRGVSFLIPETQDSEELTSLHIASIHTSSPRKSAGD